MNDFKTTWREKIGYGIGAVGLDLSYGMFYSFLSYYLSSGLGLKEAFLLLLTPLARIWDGINDPLMGTIVDNPSLGVGVAIMLMFVYYIYVFWFCNFGSKIGLK